MSLTSNLVSLHWNGRRWRLVPLPVPQSAAPPADPQSPVTIALSGYAFGVAARTPSDAWAVGMGPSDEPLSWHWNGRRWRLVPVSSGLRGRQVQRIVLGAHGDAWAVIGVGQADKQLVLHWAGNRWNRPPQPAGSALAIAITPSDDVWVTQPIQHWNGHGWTLSRPGRKRETLTGITAVSSGDLWAVGYIWPEGTTEPIPLALHCGT